MSGKIYRAELSQIDGSTLWAKTSSGHSFVIDTSSIYGGNDSAPSPFEYFVASIAGCTSVDVISLLKKFGIRYEKYRIEIEAERSEEHPRVPTRVRIKYIFYGKGIDEELVKKAITLSQEKYCSLSAVVKKTATVEWEYEVRAE